MEDPSWRPLGGIPLRRPLGPLPGVVSERRLVIAIDYGTIYTGVAYATPLGNRAWLDGIDLVQDWGPRMRNLSKVPSVISYSSSSEANEQQWGADLSPDAIPIANTKLQLDINDSSEELDLTLQALDEMHDLDFRYMVDRGAGKYSRKAPEDIVKDYLTKVFEHLWKAVASFSEPFIEGTSVDIVATVPTSWSYSAKNSLFRALTRAGFNKESFPQLREMLLVSEPEAATIYTVRYLNEVEERDFLRKGDCFIVCDAGGGTADVVSYKVKELEPTLEISQVAVPTSSEGGSISINLAFKKWLRQLLGTNLYQELDQAQPATKISSQHAGGERMRELMKRFEVHKKMFAKGYRDIKMDLPEPLENLNLNNRVVGGQITITYKEMASFFDPYTARIINSIQSQLAQIEMLRVRVKNVLLVGGLAEFPYLQEELRHSLSLKNIELLAAEGLLTAVVRGATIFGIEKASHKGRITMSACGRSYGVSAGIYSTHDSRNRVPDLLTTMTQEKLIWLIKKEDLILSNQPIEVSATFTRNFTEGALRAGSIPIFMYGGDLDATPDRLPDSRNELTMVHIFDYDLQNVPQHEFIRISALGPNLPIYLVEFNLIMRLDPGMLHMELCFKGRVLSTADITDPEHAEAMELTTIHTSSPVSHPMLDQSILPTAISTVPITESSHPAAKSTVITAESTVPTTVSGLPTIGSTLPTTVSGSQDKSLPNDFDTQSIITDGQSLPDLPELVREKAISKIGLEILESTESFFLGLETASQRSATATKIARALPTLLKEFSRELSIMAQPGIQRKAATFVRRYRRKIATSFEASVTNLDNDSGADARTVDRVDYKEKINTWRYIPEMVEQAEQPHQFETEPLVLDYSNLNVQVSTQDQLSDDDWTTNESSDDDEREDDIIGGEDARNFIFASQAYQRLVARIQAASDGKVLTSPNGQVIEEIRDSILEILLPEPVANQTAKQTTLSCSFQVSWQPLKFLQEQYSAGHRQAIADVITLTGSAISDTQAITCGEYMDQAWPRLGSETLKALQATINQTVDAKASQPPDEVCLSDGTLLTIRINLESLIITVQGSAISAADLGEQFAWLGAACRESPFDRCIAYARASFTKIEVGYPFWSCSYSMEKVSSEESFQEGGCWQALFRNPVIAKGFQIPARVNSEKGLEIPLDIMARLGGAERATVFSDQLVIKGFSTLFVPTKRVQNSVIWHFLFNESRKRMSYLAAKTCKDRALIDSVNYSHLSLDSARTFLGWSSSFSLYTGTYYFSSTGQLNYAAANAEGHLGSEPKDIGYDTIEATDLSYPRRPILLDKISITGGKYVNARVSATIGLKDRGISFSSEVPYRLKMYEASRMNVVLYDTQDRRGWLVDGANALIHLTRTSLLHEPYCDFPLIEGVLERFPHTKPVKGPKAALNALNEIGESENLIILRDTPVFGQSTSTVSEFAVKDVVLNHWELLELMHDHQMDMEGIGKEIRLTTRDRLDGYEFQDMVVRNKRIRARAAFVKPSARGWVEFIRMIDAITLMAKGFGDLIRPAENCNSLCSSWTRVPCGRDYLVARIHHLREISRDAGRDLHARPLEIVEGIYWHQGGELFGDCNASCSASCDRVQTLYHKTTRGSKTQLSSFDGYGDGAVIFGRSDRVAKQFPSWWSEDPKESSTTDQDSQQDSFRDSGIGTSATSDELGTSTSRSKKARRALDRVRTLLSSKPHSRVLITPEQHERMVALGNQGSSSASEQAQGANQAEQTQPLIIPNIIETDRAGDSFADMSEDPDSTGVVPHAANPGESSKQASIRNLFSFLY